MPDTAGSTLDSDVPISLNAAKVRQAVFLVCREAKRKHLRRRRTFGFAVENTAKAAAFAAKCGSSGDAISPSDASALYMRLHDLVKLMTKKARRIKQKKMPRSTDPELLCYLRWWVCHDLSCYVLCAVAMIHLYDLASYIHCIMMLDACQAFSEVQREVSDVKEALLPFASDIRMVRQHLLPSAKAMKHI